ncbi:MAG: hypothetical protein JW844_03380 [Candidatus Omnitrophica bacterium]|nr:hypothetical protein [Candidatus Omnitrophota bacterium]
MSSMYPFLLWGGAGIFLVLTGFKPNPKWYDWVFTITGLAFLLVTAFLLLEELRFLALR